MKECYSLLLIWNEKVLRGFKHEEKFKWSYLQSILVINELGDKNFQVSFDVCSSYSILTNYCLEFDKFWFN